MDIPSVNVNNINLDNSNFYGDEPKTFICVRLLRWHNKLKKCKTSKKEISKELVLVVWHPTKWWNWSMSKDEKKEIEIFFF